MNQLIKQLGMKPKGGNVYFNDYHRVTITGELWNCHKCDKGGAGSIALVMHVLDLGFMDARKWLGDDVSIPMPVQTTKEPTTLPANDPKTLPAVIAYLCTKRGLNPVMVDWCIKQGLIYSDSKSNACFRYGQGVAMRGTGNTSFKTNRGLLSEPFTLPAKGTCDGLALVESAIDALSYRQLHLTRIVCSIAGNGNTKLMQSALDTALKLEVPVYSAFDNDTGGNEGHERLLKLNKKNKIVRHEPIEAKDWNDYLITML